MATFDLTYRFGRKTATVRASGLNRTCAEVEALGELWERWGDRALDSDGARLVNAVEVSEARAR